MKIQVLELVENVESASSGNSQPFILEFLPNATDTAYLTPLQQQGKPAATAYLRLMARRRALEFFFSSF